MPSPYNTQSRQTKVNYRENDDDDDDESEDESDEESTQSPQSQRQQSYTTSPRSRPGGSGMDSSGMESSALSSTASDSFSYHSGQSPSAEPKGRTGKLYPDLSLSGSPVTKRRGLHGKVSAACSPEASSPDRGGKKSVSPKPSKLKKNSAHDDHPTEQQSFFKVMSKNPRALACLFFISLLVIYLVWSKESPSANTEQLPSTPPGFDVFIGRVDKLRETFPGQDARFWKVIKACTRHVFDPDLATYPCVLLMVGDRKDTTLTASIAGAVSHEFGHAMHKQPATAVQVSLNMTTTLGRLAASQQKFELDEWLKGKLDHNSAVVVNHLEDLLPQAALLLHGYCDGDNAPYKEAMLILGLYLDKGMPVDSLQAAVESVLRDLWLSDLTEDKVGALLSRVANNVVMVKAPPQ